jgi:bifunctional ADP-heptose synthase (sugar kinase/adenylyltransferase)
MLLYLRAVDYVAMVNEPSCCKAIRYLKPDIFITVGEDWNKNCYSSPEAKAVRAGGGRVVVVKRQSPKISTTAIMDSIVARQILKHFKRAIDTHNGALSEHA